MGKSTLLNALLEEDLCIATRRPQTTRHAILGIMTTASSQLCLIDTPGIIQDPAYKLQEGMMEAVKGTFQDSDAFLVVTDLFSTPIPDDSIFEKLTRTRKPVVVAINKVDLEGIAAIPSQQHFDSATDDDADEDNKTYTVPEAVATWRELLPNALAIIPLSAAEGASHPGVNLLRKILLGEGDISSAVRNIGRPVPGMFLNNQHFLSDQDAKTFLPLGPPLYEQDVLTDRSERFFCAELIRESLFECLNKEVPYCCEVQVHYFKEPRSGSQQKMIDIKANIYVERDSQKGIVVGKGGQQLKEVGILAREKIERFLGEPVSLNLYVLVSKDWRKSEEQLKRFGYTK
jgi:GTPase